MTQLAPILQAFFTTRLVSQYGASTHTIAAYRDSWRLLLRYAAQETGTAPTALDLSQLDAGLITGFLTHLETERGNSTTTRNAPPGGRAFAVLLRRLPPSRARRHDQ